MITLMNKSGVKSKLLIIKNSDQIVYHSSKLEKRYELSKPRSPNQYSQPMER